MRNQLFPLSRRGENLSSYSAELFVGRLFGTESVCLPLTFTLRPKRGDSGSSLANLHPSFLSRVVVVVVVVVLQHLHFFPFFTFSQKILPAKIFSEGNLKQFSPSPSLLMELKENSQVFFLLPKASPLNHPWSDPLRLSSLLLSPFSPPLRTTS